MVELVQPDAGREAVAFEEFQRKVEGTNIDQCTLLATDYLNHFNEAVMLIDMIPEMPDCLEMAKEWRPKTYQEHFRDSVFTDKELAIAAYDHVPSRYREAFEQNIARMNRLILDSLAWIDTAQARSDTEKVGAIVAATSRVLKKLIESAGAIVHGGEGTTMDQSEIDSMLLV